MRIINMAEYAEREDTFLRHSRRSRRLGKKTILKSLSGHFKSGQLTAIMGPSGAGKSTLLNALTGFSAKNLTGTLIAGQQICDLGKISSQRALKEHKRNSCYILQDDRLDPLFTVAELMKFAADVKLSNTLSLKMKQTMIQEIFDTLGLSGTENTRCSNLSGGQRKRLSIGVELIDDPPVVFLDEPTTGLDSLSSMQCIQMLKTLAKDGRTIICSIHQPSASMYSMFDQVYIMADGMCIYKGDSNNTVPYLASAGLQCPMYHNPADYILEIANGEHGSFNEMLSKECIKRDWTKKNLINEKSMSNGRIVDATIMPPNETYKFGVLVKRSILQMYRDWTVTHLKVLLHIFIGVILGLIFDNAGNDGAKIINNLGYLLVSIVYLCYTSLMPAVLKFPSELSILKKENFNNWYNLKTYYAAALITGVPIQIWYSFVFSAPSYFISGQPQEWFRFGMFVLVLALVTLLADAIGNVIGTLVNPINGTFIGAITTCGLIVFAGFLVLLAHMNIVLRGVAYLTCLKHAFEALALSLYSFGRKPVPCPESQIYCHSYRFPPVLMKEFSFEPNNFWVDVGILFAQIIVVRLIAFWTLRSYVKKSI